ncbi:spore coat U domain-containing protein [Lacibacterium aquatile]|uniref:Spore coat U domain-containing protein n=1 Tax=Lacibacterium aquatile TaxID=1168082 RepID=A0ABW5DLZ4_9PROT
MTKQLNILALTVAAAAMVSLLPATGAQAATASTSILVTAAVAQACIVVATPLAFGVYDPTSASPTDGTATVAVTCTTGTAYTVGLSAGGGTGATTTVRKMTFGANTLNYALYQNAGRTTNWGNAVGTDTVAGTATGLLINHTVYGRITAGQTVPMGAYADTVAVTVTY